MIVRLNTGLANRILNCICDPTTTSPALFDNGTAYFRTGAQPADADNAPTGTVVATVALAADAMGTAVSGSISKTGAAWQDLSADASGTIGWVRIVDATTTLWMDLDVTNSLGTGAVKVDNPALLAGQEFIVVAFTLTQPRTT